MAWMMAAQLGMSALQGIMGHKAAKAKAKSENAWRAYSNSVINLGNAVNQNAITTNEIMAMQSSTFQATELKKLQASQEGLVETAAAAAGVKGRSVNQSMFSVQRNAATAERDRQVSLSNQFAAFDQQRLSSAMSAANQQDHTKTPKPSLMSSMLPTVSKAIGFGMSGGFSGIGSSLSGMFGGGSATAATSSTGVGLSQGSSTGMLSNLGVPSGTAFTV